ncbi:DivIVA domain-containing protein [Sciscionella marina]|uniref:DivIVA domain-containing protein n=1 Tax=Sciscionella marina TaxID=508770 RepID=UPI0003807BBE|nr:DivIVA domain-containing protein [Sciscionella marina]
MTTALIYLLVLLLVAAVVYLIAVFVFGRGEELAPLPPGSSPTRLPVDRIAGTDARAVRFQQALRGYRMSEVDWVISRLADEVDQLRAELENTGQQSREDAHHG